VSVETLCDLMFVVTALLFLVAVKAQEFQRWPGFSCEGGGSTSNARSTIDNYRSALVSVDQCKSLCAEREGCIAISYYLFGVCTYCDVPSRCYLIDSTADTKCLWRARQGTLDTYPKACPAFTTAFSSPQLSGCQWSNGACEALEPVSLVYAPESSVVCPQGSQAIWDEASCRALAGPHGLSWGGTSERIVGWPPGCIKDLWHEELYFNYAPMTRGAKYMVVVCEQASAAAEGHTYPTTTLPRFKRGEFMESSRPAYHLYDHPVYKQPLQKLPWVPGGSPSEAHMVGISWSAKLPINSSPSLTTVWGIAGTASFVAIICSGISWGVCCHAQMMSRSQRREMGGALLVADQDFETLIGEAPPE